MPEALNPLPEKPSGPRSGPESYSNGGFRALGNFGKDEFLSHPPDWWTIWGYFKPFSKKNIFSKFVKTKKSIESDFSNQEHVSLW